MPEVETAPKTVHTVHNPAVPMQILRNINGLMMKSYMEIIHLSMIINYPVIALD